MSKYVKDKMMTGIRERLNGATDMLVLNCSKVNPQTDNKMRMALRKSGIRLVSVKNSLARRALSDVPGLAGLLKGPTTLVVGGDDIVALSKEMTKWAKNIKDLQIKGAAVDGQSLDASGVDELSKSPGRAELLSKISGLLLAPGGRLAAALLGPGGYLNGQLKAISEKEEAAAPETAA